jgi:hypothetical protein
MRRYEGAQRRRENRETEAAHRKEAKQATLDGTAPTQP